MRDFAINNGLPFSIKAYEIGDLVGYKVVPGEKEGYERCCSGAESCMRMLKDRDLLDFDIRRHTGFIVKNVKVFFDDECEFAKSDEGILRWLKLFDNGSTDFEDHEYEYELGDVIKFNKDLLSSEKPVGIKIKINDISKEEIKESTPEEWNDEMVWKDYADDGARMPMEDEFHQPENLDSVTNEIFPVADYDNLQTLRSLEQNSTRLTALEYWKSTVESELVALLSRIDVLDNGNVAEEKADCECYELAKSRPYVLSMMYLSRFFQSGVRKDNKIIATKPHLCEFSKVSTAINNNVALRVDSFQHKDIHIAEMSGAIVVALSARDNPQFFVSMNKEEKELYNQCAEMFNEFNKNDFQFHSDAYCQTSHWKIKRAQKILASPPGCSECHRHVDELFLKIPIQVHHINDASYSRIFRENLEDLEVLCKECHEKKHPKKQQDEHNANNDE